ncbi:hypothetical protein NL526_30065, partial [Klebsiella pneumoniae]|nr:hypothetical protein [Klebsiella pneumoniae]
MKAFLLLQILDMLTTLIGLRLGLMEGMRVPAALIGQTNPVAGLMVCKLMAVALAAVALLLGRRITL